MSLNGEDRQVAPRAPPQETQVRGLVPVSLGGWSGFDLCRLLLVPVPEDQLSLSWWLGLKGELSRFH